MVYRDTRTDDPVQDTRPAARERAVERRGWSFGPPGPGMILGLVGALAILVSLFTAWSDPGVHADDVPLRFLVDNDVTGHHPSLLLVLIPLLVLAVIGSLLPGGAVVRLVAGIGTLVVAGLFAFQMEDLVTNGDTLDVLDVGFYFAAVGGLLTLVSGFVPTGWHSRRTVDRYVDAG